MADKFALVTDIPAAFPALDSPQVACGSGWRSIKVVNRDASNYIEVSLDGVNVADRICPQELGAIFEQVEGALGVWLRGPGTPDAKVTWE